jgi:sulfite reductase (ferredoxin)
LVPTLVPLLTVYKAERQDGESFGNYCARIGKDGLAAKVA